MNPWLAFLLGMLWTALSIGAVGGLLLHVASSTPRMALASLAGLLRGFSKRVDDLHVVLVCPQPLRQGEPLHVPFEALATAIENAELTRHRARPEALN